MKTEWSRFDKQMWALSGVLVAAGFIFVLFTTALRPVGIILIVAGVWTAYLPINQRQTWNTAYASGYYFAVLSLLEAIAVQQANRESVLEEFNAEDWARAEMQNMSEQFGRSMGLE